jgi:hypothetical protein
VDDDNSNLDELLGALAAKCDAVTNLDYALVDANVISSFDLTLIQTDGDTPHKEVNARWHRELIKLSASNIMELANAIVSSGETKRALPNKTLELIANCVQGGKIDKAVLSQSIRDRLKNAN